MVAPDLPAHSTLGSHRLLLLLFCFAIWLPGLPARTLWPTDEPRYAMIAVEMLQRGDFVVPVKRGDIYHSQPPLFIWSEALTISLMGSSAEAVLRIPSVVAGAGGVLVVHALASAWFGPGAGLLSGLVLATDLRYLLQAQWVSTDMLLCFLITASLACFAEGYRSRRGGWYLACYAFASAATLTKGPVGFVLPGLVILCFLTLRRDLREVLRMRLLRGAVIFMVLVLPWYVLFWARAGGGEIANMVLTQSVQRYVAAWNNQQPWYYFIWRLPADLLPWTPVLPFAAWLASKRMPDRERLFLFCWMAAMFVFFSVSTGKRGVYLLPLHPAAAILAGWFWDSALRAPEGERMERRLRLCALLTGLVFVGGGVALLWLPGTLAAIPGAAKAAAILGGLALAGGAAVALSPARLVPKITAAAMGLLAVTAVVIAAPIENQRLDSRGFAAEVARLVPPGARLGIVHLRFEELVYYSGRAGEIELKPGRRLDRWMRQPGTVYAVLDRRSYNDLVARALPPWELLARGNMAGGEYFLIVKR